MSIRRMNCCETTGFYRPPICSAESGTAAATGGAAPAAGFDIRILSERFLRGPGFWTYRPALEALLDIGALEDFPSDKLPGLPERLEAWLPGLIEHKCGVGVRGGFLMRLREGTWAGHIMEHIAIELMLRAGLDAGFGKTRMAGDTPGIYKLVLRAEDESVAHAALHAARELLLAAIKGEAYDVQAAVTHIRETHERDGLDPDAQAIVQTAGERGIPCIRLAGALVQLGWGQALQRVWGARTERTGAIAAGIADDWLLARRLLDEAGVPVPDGVLIESADEAWEEAQDIGLPVALRPLTIGAEGAALHLQGEDEVRTAWERAHAASDEVLLERCIDGEEHRMLLINGRLAAAMLKGSDVTGQVHPSTVALAALACRVLGLDSAGVSVVARDIAQPLEVQGGAFVAVHPAPSLLHYLGLAGGRALPAARVSLQQMFALGSDGRIPLAGVLGADDGDGALAAHMLARMLRLAGHCTALACADGLYLDEHRLAKGDARSFEPSQRLLMNRSAQAAVIETTAHAILAQGLPYDRCHVGILMGVPSAQGLGEFLIKDEQMPDVARTQLDVVLPQGTAVINADDEDALTLAKYSDGEVLLYSCSPTNAALAAHRRSKGRTRKWGRAVFASGTALVLAAGSREWRLELPTLLDIDDLPAALAATAAAWALGLPLPVIRAALLHVEERTRSYDTDLGGLAPL